VPKLPRIKPSEVIRVLQRLGFVQVRQRGSHVILKKTICPRKRGTKNNRSWLCCTIAQHNCSRGNAQKYSQSS
jgi:hypothetical protein